MLFVIDKKVSEGPIKSIPAYQYHIANIKNIKDGSKFMLLKRYPQIVAYVHKSSDNTITIKVYGNVVVEGMFSQCSFNSFYTRDGEKIANKSQHLLCFTCYAMRRFTTQRMARFGLQLNLRRHELHNT